MSNVIHDAYLHGYATKCAEAGVDPEHLTKQAGWGSSIAGLFTNTIPGILGRYGTLLSGSQASKMRGNLARMERFVARRGFANPSGINWGSQEAADLSRQAGRLRLAKDRLSRGTAGNLRNPTVSAEEGYLPGLEPQSDRLSRVLKQIQSGYTAESANLADELSKIRTARWGTLGGLGLGGVAGYNLLDKRNKSYVPENLYSDYRESVS